MGSGGNSPPSDSVTATPEAIGSWTHEMVLDPTMITVGAGIAAVPTYRATFPVDSDQVSSVASLSAETTAGELGLSLDEGVEDAVVVGLVDGAAADPNAAEMAGSNLFSGPTASDRSPDLTAGTLTCEMATPWSIYAKSDAPAGNYALVTTVTTPFTLTAVVNEADRATSTPSNTDILDATLTVQAPVVPAKPTGLTARGGDESITLRWDDPSDSSITKPKPR